MRSYRFWSFRNGKQKDLGTIDHEIPSIFELADRLQIDPTRIEILYRNDGTVLIYERVILSSGNEHLMTRAKLETV